MQAARMDNLGCRMMILGAAAEVKAGRLAVGRWNINARLAGRGRPPFAAHHAFRPEETHRILANAAAFLPGRNGRRADPVAMEEAGTSRPTVAHRRGCSPHALQQ